MKPRFRRPQVAVLGSAVVSGCGSPATRVAAERALAAGGVTNAA